VAGEKVVEKARKHSVHQALDLPDCTFEQMKLRCETETTVLKRIMHCPLPMLPGGDYSNARPTENA
jgi:hypothetical protein